jgi:hypothetical protein
MDAPTGGLVPFGSIIPNPDGRTLKYLKVRYVPFRTSEKVEVIILSAHQRDDEQKQYSLRGQPIRFTAPFDGVDESDREASR